MPEQILAILIETEKTANLLVQSVKSEQNLFDMLVNDINRRASLLGQTGKIPQQVAAYQTSVSSAIGQANNLASALDSSQKSIAASLQAIENYELTDPMDLTNQENAVSQKEAALQDAKDNLANYIIRAPFAGKLANVDLQKGDSVSSSTLIASLVTNSNYAAISLNEIDVANIKIGQKATITFDAITDLTLTGSVSDIDALGAVNQGVVNYGVKINFDTQDTRIKPGMSVSVAIITDVKNDVLMLSSTAIKSSNGGNYVEIPSDSASVNQLLASAANSPSGISLASAPLQQTVELGLANDSMTEITSGLSEGDWVITRTITASAAVQANQTRSILQGGAGSNIRGNFQGR